MAHLGDHVTALREIAEVRDFTWVAEVCLWASWAYQGDLVALAARVRLVGFGSTG